MHLSRRTFLAASTAATGITAPPPAPAARPGLRTGFEQRPGGVRPRTDRDRAAGDRQAGVERFRVAFRQLDRQADRFRAGAHDGRRGADPDDVVAGRQEESAAFRRVC